MRYMLYKISFVLLLAAITLFLFLPPALAGINENEATVYYFWGFCPICSKPEEHVGLFDQYPVKVEIYEVFQDPVGREVYDQFAGELDIEIYGFPTIVFEGRYWLGFTESTQTEIVEAINAHLAGEDITSQTGLVDVPFFGEVDLLASPILLTTIIIATLDGFNPCSLFVLTFLLAIIVHSASRKRIVLVGLTFLAVTSIVYGLFMLGVLNIMIYAGGLFWIRNVVAVAVIILGLISIKDYLFFKEGVSVMIPDSYKQKYYSQVRRIFYTKSVIPAVLATTTMALGIALVELPCTAGFPFVWSSIAGRLDLSATYFAVLFAVYLFLYLLIELIVFFLAVLRMRSLKMTEEQGRFLKLVAGSLMFILGLILLVKPEYMENMLGILITFIAALVMLVVFRLIRRVVDRKKETGRPIQ
jgi:cytochrome c biogenesis protein CcdA